MSIVGDGEDHATPEENAEKGAESIEKQVMAEEPMPEETIPLVDSSLIEQPATPEIHHSVRIGEPVDPEALADLETDIDLGSGLSDPIVKVTEAVSSLNVGGETALQTSKPSDSPSEKRTSGKLGASRVESLLQMTKEFPLLFDWGIFHLLISSHVGDSAFEEEISRMRTNTSWLRLLRNLDVFFFIFVDEWIKHVLLITKNQHPKIQWSVSSSSFFFLF